MKTPQWNEAYLSVTDPERTYTAADMEGSMQHAFQLFLKVRKLEAQMDEWRYLLGSAVDYIEQYHRYSEEMREIGRGFVPSSEFAPLYLVATIRAALGRKP